MKKIKQSIFALLLSVIVLFSAGCNFEVNEPSLSTSDTSSTVSASSAQSESKSEEINSASERQETDTNSNKQYAPVGNGKVTPIKPNELPSFSGKPYVAINNNIPSFGSSELSIKGYEKYGSLDSLGRCTAAVACCGREIMPKPNEQRGSISSINPTGWVQAKYDNISGKYLYNRCHLIGWQLSAENANKQNLITGTKYLNISGMLPFENMVADYIKETNNHVAYRITPIYDGNNLLASGVQMEAYSVEDNGNGICFNVYCFNVQPDITINYATGQSSGRQTQIQKPVQSSSSNTTSTTVSRVEQPQNSQRVYRTPTGKRYHLISTCGGKNSYEVTKEQAINAGLTPCQKCAQ